jgi:hypothetical protein
MSKITKPLTALTPAYGRDYHNAITAKGDFLDGRDFILRDITSPWDGKPCNIDAFASGVTVMLYYYETKKSTVVTVP